MLKKGVKAVGKEANETEEMAVIYTLKEIFAEYELLAPWISEKGKTFFPAFAASIHGSA